MYGKIVDGKLIIAGSVIQTSKGSISNPKQKDLTDNGYKLVEFNQKPEYDIENEKLVERYTDGTTIIVSYEKVELTDYEHNIIINNEIKQKEELISVGMIARALSNMQKGSKDISDIETINEILDEINELKKKLR